MSYVKKATRAVSTLSPAEQKKLLDVSGQHVDGFRDHMIFSVALGTALREHEIAALDIGDVARSLSEIRSKITLRVYARKGKEPAEGKKASRVQQRVFVPKMVRRKLQKFLAWKKQRGEDVRPGAPLFCSNRAQRISTRTMRHMFRVWQRRADFEHLYTFHHLRHSSLTALYKRSKDLLLVREQARHANVTTTEIYAHASDQDVRAAVEDLIS